MIISVAVEFLSTSNHMNIRNMVKVEVKNTMLIVEAMQAVPPIICPHWFLAKTMPPKCIGLLAFEIFCLNS